jgi:hypothetical protein
MMVAAAVEMSASERFSLSHCSAACFVEWKRLPLI